MNIKKTKITKSNLKNGSNLVLKILLPELDLDWDGLYFYFRDKKDGVVSKIKDFKKDNV